MSEPLNEIRRQLGVDAPLARPAPTPRYSPPPPQQQRFGRDRVRWGWVLTLLIAVAVVYAAIQATPSGSDGTRGGGSVSATAQEQLDALVTSEQDQIEDEFSDSWVPQLASMAVGDGSSAGTADAVLSQHEALVERFGALLLRSDSYVYRLDDYYVSIAPLAFRTSGEALDWCRAQSLGPDDCYAKFLTHDPGVTPNVAHPS